MRGLFDKTWREKNQDIIWSIKNESNFWYLMNQKINASKVFFAYLRIRNQGDYIRAGDCVMMDNDSSENYDLNAKTISRVSGIKLINFTLNSKIQEKEEVVTSFLLENEINFTKDEIYKGLRKCEESLFISDEPTKCNQLLRLILKRRSFLIKKEKTGIGIWRALKDFTDQEQDFEFDDSGDRRIDCLGILKEAQVNIDNILIDLLCEKVKNKNKLIGLKTELKKWQQFNMLRWCVIDYSAMRQLSVFNQIIWRLIIFVFL